MAVSCYLRNTFAQTFYQLKSRLSARISPPVEGNTVLLVKTREEHRWGGRLCCEILHSPISIWERLNLLGCKNVRRTFRLIFPEKLTLYVIIYGGVIFFSRFHRVRLRWKKKIPILKNLRPFKWISLERAVSLLPFRSEFLNKWILGPPTWVDLSRNNFQRRVAEKINKNNKIKDKKRKRGKKKKTRQTSREFHSRALRPQRLLLLPFGRKSRKNCSIMQRWTANVIVNERAIKDTRWRKNNLRYVRERGDVT